MTLLMTTGSLTIAAGAAAIFSVFTKSQQVP